MPRTPARPRAYDFTHEKLRGLVYDETSLARRRLLHGRAAQVAVGAARTAAATRTAQAAQIGRHFRLAGQDADAAAWLALAGDHARSLYANAEALAHYQAALALGHPETSRLHEAIGDMHTLLGAYAAALASYETAAALCDGDSRANPALAEIEHKLGNVHARRGEWTAAEAHFAGRPGYRGRRGPACCGRPHPGRLRAWPPMRRDSRIERWRWRKHAGRGGIGGRPPRYGPGLQHPRHPGAQPRPIAPARPPTSNAAWPSPKRCPIPTSRIAALNNLALARAEGGDLAQATALAEQALALGVAMGDRHREAALRNNLADLLHSAGREEEAMAQLKQAVVIFAEIGVSRPATPSRRSGS